MGIIKGSLRNNKLLTTSVLKKQKQKLNKKKSQILRWIQEAWYWHVQFVVVSELLYLRKNKYVYLLVFINSIKLLVTH